MDWKTYKNPGPFKIDKTLAGTRYNTGDAIVDVNHPVWDLKDKSGIPITPTHDPCGYWNNVLDLIDPFTGVTSRPYPIEVFEATESLGATLISMRYTNQTYNSGLPEGVESYGAPLVGGNLTQTFFLVSYTSGAAEGVESLGASIITGNLGVAFILKVYSNYQSEATEAYGASLISGDLGVGITIVSYSMLPEATESLGSTVIGGSLG